MEPVRGEIRLENPEHLDFASKWLPKDCKWALISPDAGDYHKQLSSQFWLDAINQCREFGYRPLIIGPPAAKSYNSAIADLARCSNFTGRDNPQSFPYILDRADIVVTTDTATSHFSDALDKFTITCFKKRNHDKFKPFWNPRVAYAVEDVVTHLEMR